MILASSLRMSVKDFFSYLFFLKKCTEKNLAHVRLQVEIGTQPPNQKRSPILLLEMTALLLLLIDLPQQQKQPQPQDNNKR